MTRTTCESEFWRAMERLIAESEIAIERPRGSHHPEHPQIVYPLDYGYLADTSSMDGASSTYGAAATRRGGLARSR